MNQDSLKIFVRSKLFAGIITGVAVAIIIVCIFEVGVAVGYHEASFSAHWGANYERNFAGPDTGGIFNFDNHAPNSHGTAGNIVSVASSTLVIASGNMPEQKVIIGSDTIIRERENTAATSSLSVGTSVVVIGTPNDQGEIEAKLIRIIPAQP